MSSTSSTPPAAAAGQDPDQLLSDFIPGDPESFWRQVNSNFRAGRNKLVVVAHSISRELARIIEFLKGPSVMDATPDRAKTYAAIRIGSEHGTTIVSAHDPSSFQLVKECEQATDCSHAY